MTAFCEGRGTSPAPQDALLRMFATVWASHFQPSGGDAPTVQRRSDLPERIRPGGLGLSNSRHDDVGVNVGLILLERIADGSGLVQPRIAEDLPRGLGGGQGGLRPMGDQGARSFSARAAYRCSRNGSTSGPSSTTRNGVLCAMRPLMKCTSRDSNHNGRPAWKH